ncbi:MAG: maf [Planctomycetaceae bacterium]|nr:maf [Planctomycetaceae bacterium]
MSCLVGKPDSARRLILASGSPYRLQLLEEQGYNVKQVVSGIDEPILDAAVDLGAGLIYLAHLKARAVARMGHDGLILAADTLSHSRGQILGKPADAQDAERMLRALSGCTHQVLTGWCLLRTDDGLSWTGVEQTEITMRMWSEIEIQNYLKSGEWKGKCGAYGLQLPLDPFVTRMQGSASSVIGVPLERLDRVWREFLCR